jgi:hypothetical protein
LLGLAGGAASGLLLIALLFRSPGAFLSWLRGQWELGAGYGDAMALGEGGWTTVLALGLLAVVATIAVHAWRNGGDGAFWWPQLLALGLLVFEHTLVRAHLLPLFPFLAAGAAVGLATASRPRELRVAVLLLTSALALGLTARTAKKAPPLEMPPLRLLRNAAAMSDLAKIRQQVARRSAELLREGRPPDLVALLDARSGSVDVIPFALGWLSDRAERWRPHPTLQLYTAYRPWLDQRVAEHFADAGSPELLVLHWNGVDGRHPRWDAPRTQRALLENYTVAAGQGAAALADGAVVVLERRAQHCTTSAGEPVELDLMPGEWLDIPATTDGQHLSYLSFAVELDANVTGRLRRWVTGVPPLRVRVVLSNGRERGWRVVPSALEEGIPVEPPLRSAQELASWWRGGEAARALRLQVVGPGVDFYRWPARASWQEWQLHAPDGQLPCDG